MSAKVEISSKLEAALQDMQKKTGLSLSDVVNEAVSLYVLAVNSRAEGKEIAVADVQNRECIFMDSPGLKNIQPAKGTAAMNFNM